MNPSQREFSHKIWHLIKMTEMAGYKVTAFKVHPNTLEKILEDCGTDSMSPVHKCQKTDRWNFASVKVWEVEDVEEGEIEVEKVSRF